MMLISKHGYDCSEAVTSQNSTLSIFPSLFAKSFIFFCFLALFFLAKVAFIDKVSQDRKKKTIAFRSSGLIEGDHTSNCKVK